jgi:hypothetical protein
LRLSNRTPSFLGGVLLAKGISGQFRTDEGARGSGRCDEESESIMEIKCQKCGASASDDQAFCAKCGAVLGMGDAGKPREDSPPNLAATVVGKFPLTPPPKPAPSPPPQSAQTPAAPPPVQTPARPSTPRPQPPVSPPTPAGPPRAGGSTALLVIIGFVAVLLVGALLIYLFLFNLRQ